jgi:hypothetical protein
MPNSRAVSGSATMPWQPTVAPVAPLARASSPPMITSTFRLLVTSRPTLLGVSAQMHGVSVPASDPQSHLHSHHSSDGIAEIATMAASGTGMIGTGAALSVKTAAIKVQWCVSRSTFCRQAANVSPSFSISIDELDTADGPLIPEASIHLLGV